MSGRKTGKITALAVALQFAIASPALAGGDEFIGGLVGGVIGGIIGSQIGGNKGHAPRQHRTSRPRVNTAPQISAETREENRRIQVSLNALECNAGTPDGAFGQRTRDAIRCFQAKVQAPITGQLTGDERKALLAFYVDLNAPGGTTTSGPTAVGGGAAGLIETLKNRPPQPSDMAPVEPVPTDLPMEAPLRIETVVAHADTSDFAFCNSAASEAAVTLPGVVAPQPVVYIDHVPVVGLCALRQKLRDDATAGLTTIGASQAQASAQCAGLAVPLSAAVGQIGVVAPGEVIDAASTAIGSMVTDIDAAVGSARLCAGIGYQENNLAMVEAASLFGAAVGDPSLIEAVGWDLAFGLGRAKDPLAGAAWLREAATQMGEVDAGLLLMPEADRTGNLMAVAAVLAPASGAAPAPTATNASTTFVLPGLGTPVVSSKP